jgi:DNA-binding SARP family transcriptional activator
MFRLGTFGGLSLEGQDGAALTVQRLRLALLALLAHAGDRGLSRDKLLGFLWAESPPDSARHKLEQALYMLRRQLGEGLFQGTDPLRLNAEILTADITEFERAIGQGEFAQAAALYRGPFLDGFYLTDADEFERWVGSERDRLAERYRWLLQQLATGADARGDAPAAIEWWRKLLAADSLSARATAGLMRALAAGGDRAGALRQAQIYDQLVRAQLETEPDPAVHALAAELRAAPPPPPPPEGREDRQAGSEHGAPHVSPAISPEPTALPPRRRHLRPILLLPAAVAGLVLLAVALRSQGSTPPVDAAAAHRIAIVPFQIAAADSSFAYLREGMVDLLAAKLTGEVGPAAVDPRTTLSAWHRAARAEGAESPAAEVRLARMVGAGQLLEGSLVQSGRGLVLNGMVRGVADRRVRAHASVSGPADSLPELVDRLTASLLALQAGEGPHRLALLTSTSLPALHAYLDGRAAYRRGESTVAMASYVRALELDSTFAVAALELVVASGWVFTWVADGFPYRLPLGSGGLLGQAGRYQLQWIRAMDIAWKNRQRLSGRDLATLNALRGSHYPEGRPARELLDTWWEIAQEAPDRADTWYLIGYILLYQGPAVGIPDASGHAVDAFHRALALDPEFTPPLAGLLELAAQRRDSAEVRRLGLEYLARDSTGPTAEYVRWHVAAVTGDAAGLQAIRRRFDSLDIETLDRIQWTAQVEGLETEDADRAMSTISRRLPADSGYVLFFATMLALNRGRPRDALRIMEEKRKIDPPSFDWYRMIYGAWWDADRAAAAASAQVIQAHARPRQVDPSTYWGMAQWWLEQGDTARALKEFELLRRGPFARDPDLEARGIPLFASLVLASIRRQPDLPALLATADSFTTRGCCNVLFYANLLVARAHERAGDLPGALAAVRRQRWYFPPEYLSAALREEGRLAALVGDTVGAIRADRLYLALRSDPEPELRSDVERVRRELERLERRP